MSREDDAGVRRDVIRRQRIQEAERAVLAAAKAWREAGDYDFAVRVVDLEEAVDALLREEGAKG